MNKLTKLGRCDSHDSTASTQNHTNNWVEYTRPKTYWDPKKVRSEIIDIVETVDIVDIVSILDIVVDMLKLGLRDASASNNAPILARKSKNK